MKKKIGITLLALVFFTGCTQAPKLKNGEERVVELSNGNISVDELYQEMKEDYALAKLIDMVDTKILSEKFPTGDEEKAYIKKQLEEAQSLYDQYFKLQYSSYEQFIGNYYGARDNLHLEKILSLIFKKQLATEDYAKRTVTEKEIKEYYENKYIGDIEASHILIRPVADQNATEADKKKAEEAALKKANEVIEKLNKGAKFEDLAKEYSEDGSASSGGKLGRFSHKKMVPEFETAAFKLKENEYSKTPVKSEFGYHIILKTKQYEKDELKNVETNIREYIAKDKMADDSNYSAKALIEIRKENKMKIDDTRLEDQYKNYVYNVTK